MRTLTIGAFKIYAVLLIIIMPSIYANAQDNSKPQINNPKQYVENICKRIEDVSNTRNIPKAFLARLLWKESRFKPNAISPKGAQGIAQFMPATAQERGLKNPFDPMQAIDASASYLVDLKQDLGNWGLAAGGYNAGPNRVKAWQMGISTLPYETRDFISSITGFPAEQWTSPSFKVPEFILKPDVDFFTACQSLPAKNLLYLNASLDDRLAPVQSWGVILTSHFSQNKALSIYAKIKQRYPSVLKNVKPTIARRVNRSFGSKPRYEVQLAANSRAKANQLCAKLKRVGGTCLVRKN